MAIYFEKTSLVDQVAEQLRDSLDSGELSSTSFLPASRELAGKYGTSLNTMQKALRQLQKEKIIKLHSKRRGFVRADIGQNAGVESKSKQIVLLLPDCSHENEGLVNQSWGAFIIHELMRSISMTEYSVSTIFYDIDSDDVCESIVSQIQNNANGVAGVLFFAAYGVGKIAKALDSIEVPWVSFNQVDGYEGKNFVTADNIGSGRILGECCARMGFEQVLFLGDSLDDVHCSSMERATGFMQSYLQKGMNFKGFRYEVCNGIMEKDGYEAMVEYLKNTGVPEIVIASGDYLAIGAMHACLDMGYSVPEDVGVIGNTGLPLAGTTRPSLTVMHQPMAEMGSKAAEMVIQMANDRVQRINGEFVPCQLVIRKSCKVDDELLDWLEEKMGDKQLVIER